MLLERTISQLDVGYVPPHEAAEMGKLGYLQWLAGLPREADYTKAALLACDVAAPFVLHSPAVAEFCRLVLLSASNPTKPLPLSIPVKKRRGGADARRHWRMPI